MRRGFKLVGVVIGLLSSLWLHGEDPPADPYANKLAKASDEGIKALKRIQIPKGLAVELQEPRGRPGLRRSGPQRQGLVHLKSEDSKELRLITAEGQMLVVARDQIEERSRRPSAMPADLVQKMSCSELRDLVEFLASLQ